MIKTTKDFHQERVSQGQNVHVINLGCARNLVDSQTILGNLKRGGHRIVDFERADVAVVNTCAFIEEAKQESLDVIAGLLELKKQGKLKRVIVAGCLAQRYHKELAVGFRDIDAIVGAQKLDSRESPSDVSLTPKHYAYVKISESCYNRCSFCVIPGIKGKFVSRTMESVIQEVKRLDDRGVREINLIGQDITAYGMDLYRELSLAKLLEKIVPVTKNIEWIRLLYAFPAHVTDELIDVIARESKICDYIDLPLQHISDRILREQNRNITARQTRDLIRRIRGRIPEGSLRTTFIVGLPGETEEEFAELLDMVRTTRFDKAGAFIYSREESTAACAMPGQITKKVKKDRLDRLMRLQQEVSLGLQERYVGRSLKVLIDDKAEDSDGVYLGRTQYDAPEVDGVVYVNSETVLRPGDFIVVKITDALEYDLVGDAVEPA
jgi:ribosomal protein S12 methylthiotransferase